MKLKRIITGVLAGVMCFGAFNVTSAFASDETNIFIVGDSTSCIYGYDDNYALPRAGWGMYLGDFLRSKYHVEDLAMSGRSSKSFATEDNYKKLLSEMNEGDYVLIQFGHNDAKKSNENDLKNRYTDSDGDINTEGSFKNSLYKNYIEPAEEKGAKPVLLTPIVRHEFEEDGKVKDTHGNYDDAIRELAKETNVPCIDVNQMTTDLYNNMGSEESIILHAIFKSTEKGDNGFDFTHLNHLGGETVAKMVAQALPAVDGLANCVNTNAVNDDKYKFMTRDEFVGEIVRLIDKTESGSAVFADVNSDNKYYDEIYTAKKLGLVQGDDKGLFNPNDYITVQDAFVIIDRMYKEENVPLKTDEEVFSQFKYASETSDYAKDAVANVLTKLNKSASTNLLPKMKAEKSACYVLFDKIYNDFYVSDVRNEAQSADEIEVVE